MEVSAADSNPGLNAGVGQPKAPVTLVFTDMVGSSAAKRAVLGADATARDTAFLESIQARHLRVVRDSVFAHRGREIMTIGDAFFLTFDDPRSALLCSAEIQMRLKAQPIMTPSGRLQLRIGIHVGTPQFFENSWHGTDVDIAARAEAAGSPNQIIVTDTARRAIGDMQGVQFRPLGTFALKGVGNVVLWDADYDGEGLRTPDMVSIEGIQRSHYLRYAKYAGGGLLAAALLVGAYFLARPKPKLQLTDKDQIILADFDNKTGDPVFDSTLKEALAIQLEQSPYLLLVNDQELHSDLRYLGQPPDQKITPALAREIGQREGIKAYLAGAVASLGDSYVVSIDAVNCGTGEVVAREQVEAADKPHVLTAVATAATNIRAKLGESLASIHKLSTPYMDVTTSSLEAFHAFSLGEDEHRKGRDLPEAESFYRQAVEQDPSFAMAYARLGTVYANAGSNAQSLEYLQKAYALRERVTERERIYIESEVALQQQNMPKAMEAFRLYTSTYPRDSSAWNNIGIVYSEMGDLEKAAASYEKSYELAKWDVVGATNSAGTLLELNRFPEAKHYLDEARIEGGMEDTNSVSAMMLYEFQTGAPEWRRVIGMASDRQDGFVLDQLAANIGFQQGAINQGIEDGERASRRAASAKLLDTDANVLATLAMQFVQIGSCPQAVAYANRALKLDHSVVSVPDSALALALCGESAQGLEEIRKLAKGNPENSLITGQYLPEVEAAAALEQHHPEQVEGLLSGDAENYAVASYAPYLEAVAYLERNDGAAAVQALAPALRWPGASLQTGSAGTLQVTMYPVALLLTARAQAMAGDKPAAASTYRQLLDIWKSADPDFKPLQQANREFAALATPGNQK